MPPITRGRRASALHQVRVESRSRTCAICLSRGAIAALECNHIFHEACTLQCAFSELEVVIGERDLSWNTKLRNMTCPLCRQRSEHYTIGSDIVTFERVTYLPSLVEWDLPLGCLEARQLLKQGDRSNARRVFKCLSVILAFVDRARFDDENAWNFAVRCLEYSHLPPVRFLRT